LTTERDIGGSSRNAGVWLAAVCFAVVGLCSVYMGGYYAMLFPMSQGGYSGYVPGEMNAEYRRTVVFRPTYKMTGNLVRGVFAPAHRIDRMVRRDMWTCELGLDVHTAERSP